MTDLFLKTVQDRYNNLCWSDTTITSISWTTEHYDGIRFIYDTKKVMGTAIITTDTKEGIVELNSYESLVLFGAFQGNNQLSVDAIVSFFVDKIIVEIEREEK